MLYFAQQAKDHDIDYIVKAQIPKDFFISDTDISALFGNLLENALDACKEEKEDGRKIIVRAGMTGGSFCATVDNTFTGSLRYTGDGDLVQPNIKDMDSARNR